MKPELKLLLKEAKPIGEMPKSSKIVKAIQLLQEHEKYTAKMYAFIAVQVEQQVYFARPTDLVPEYASVLRDSTGALLGIPAVVGG